MVFHSRGMLKTFGHLFVFSFVKVYPSVLSFSVGLFLSLAEETNQSNPTVDIAQKRETKTSSQTSRINVELTAIRVSLVSLSERKSSNFNWW